MKNPLHKRCSLLVGVLFAAAIAVPCRAMPSPQSQAIKDWQKVQTSGTNAFEANQYGLAERLLKEATIKARAFEPGDVRFSQSSGELGRLLTVRGRFAEAEPYLEEELHLKLLGTYDEKESGKLIPDMGSMARFYLTYGTAKKAQPMTEDVLFFVEGKIKEEEEAHEAAKREKGAPLVGWAGQAAPAMTNPLIEWAITCDDLGNLFAAHSRYDLSDRLYKAALDVKATVLGKQHLSLANSYESLGNLCLMKNEDAAAESYYKDALEITEKIQPPSHPQVYSRIDRLARCLIKEGKYDEAEQLYLRAQKLWKGDAAKSGNEPRALFALACVYCDEKKYATAAPLFRRALQLAEQFNGACSVQLAPYLRKYAYALYYLGQRGEADHLKARADFISPIIPALTPAHKMEAGDWSRASK